MQYALVLAAIFAAVAVANPLPAAVTAAPAVRPRQYDTGPPSSATVPQPALPAASGAADWGHNAST